MENKISYIIRLYPKTNPIWLFVHRFCRKLWKTLSESESCPQIRVTTSSCLIVAGYAITDASICMRIDNVVITGKYYNRRINKRDT